MLLGLWLVAWMVHAGVSDEHLQRALQRHLNCRIAAAIEEYPAHPEADDVEARSNLSAALVKFG
jgi:hypothetical protein